MTTAVRTATGTIHIPSLAADLPSNWQWRRLDEACDGVFDCPHSTPVLTTDGPFVVRTQDVMTGTFRGDQAARVSEETYEERIRRAEPQHGDLLYSREGTYFGVAAEVPQGTRVCLGQRMVLLRPKPKEIYARYLKYWLNSPVLASHVNGQRDGTVAERLNMPTIRALPVPVPPFKTQREIGDILGSLDDKIELNRRMKETLESLARRLFKSWFVDFDPVHAKTAVRRQHPTWTNERISREALAKLEPRIAELFPDDFEESTLGLIPKRWRATTVPDAIEVNPFRSLPKGVEAAWLEMANMPTRSARALAWERRAFGSGTKFKNGDTLVARITPCLENGKTAYVDFLDDGEVGAGSTEYIVLCPKAPLPPEFGYFLARNDYFRQHLITNMTGTSGRQRAPADCLNTCPIVVPDSGVADRFGDFASMALTQMKQNDEESQSLIAARDRLLPQLLTGSIDFGVA